MLRLNSSCAGFFLGSSTCWPSTSCLLGWPGFVADFVEGRFTSVWLCVQKEASAVALFVCVVWSEEASSVVCAWTVLCAAAACTALAVPPRGACSDAGVRRGGGGGSSQQQHLSCGVYQPPGQQREQIVDAQAAALRGCDALLAGAMTMSRCALGPGGRGWRRHAARAAVAAHHTSFPAVAVWLTAAGRAARHGVACGERLVRSEPVCRCGTGLRATHRHARTAHTILMVLVHEEVPLHLLSARLYRGHREGGAASHFLHSISCSTAGAPPGSKDQAACAAATESLRAASRGATVTAAASCRLEVPPTQHCAAALCRAARGQTGSAFEGLSSTFRLRYRVRAPHTIYHKYRFSPTTNTTHIPRA